MSPDTKCQRHYIGNQKQIITMYKFVIKRYFIPFIPNRSDSFIVRYIYIYILISDLNVSVNFYNYLVVNNFSRSIFELTFHAPTVISWRTTQDDTCLISSFNSLKIDLESMYHRTHVTCALFLSHTIVMITLDQVLLSIYFVNTDMIMNACNSQ